MKKKSVKRVLQTVLAMGLLTFTACGNNTASNPDNPAEEEAYVYVPRYIALDDADEDSYNTEMVFSGNRFYYLKETYGEQRTSGYYYLDVAETGAKPVQLLTDDQIPSFEIDENNCATSTYGIYPQEEGVILVTSTCPLIDSEAGESEYRRQQEETVYSMYKLDENGGEVFRMDITEQLHMDMNNAYLQYFCADGEGNLYISNGESYVWIYDKEGRHLADVKLDGGWISSMGVTADGQMAILQSMSGGPKVLAYDETTQSFSKIYKELPPDCYNSNIATGEKGILLNNETGLYEYDMENQTYEEILKWLDCDIQPDYIEKTARMDNGSYVLYTRDWSSGDENLVVLEKKPASEVTEKETITIACMNQTQALQSAVVNFNKTNEKYRVEIIDYSSSIDWASDHYETDRKDAMTRFNNDMIAGNGADMFCTGDIDMEVMAMKGVIEDLTPCLENSEVVKRDDLFESVLDAYTVKDVLCAIPDSFIVMTLVGRTAEIGEETGWTMQDMMAYAKEYPEADILPEASKQTILFYSMLFDTDSFVNWEKGECYFDTPEFKELLEFANGYADSDEEYAEEDSVPIQIRNHEILLYTMNLVDGFEWQITEAMFGEEMTAIGYPSSTGNGVLVNGNGAISINAASDNKEAAWSFIESLLTEESQEEDTFRNGLPIRISAYEKQMEKAMEPEYQYDENGELLLDENGEPIEISSYGYGWGDFSLDVYAVSEREADNIWKTINSIDGIYHYDEELMAILEEEVAPYFAGQKTVDEVADVIQSRVQIYVSERL